MTRTLNDIRSTFLDFFGDNDHEIVSSSPLVPHNDPTLMFVNSGMVPFKDMFTGKEKRGYTRATSAQKCVRAGGKHNDLDNVGYTARHHTFFEMLGNFSFGDYFKEEAIHYAWELITKEFGINKDKLLMTVYHTDDEAFDLWKKITGFSDDRIIRIPTSDNFWSMGDTGPCGPCTEIFYDHGDHIFGGPPGSKDEDGDRFIEIWNLVFTQFDQQADGTRIDLPNPCVDTGMGLERVAALLQGSHDNYETDLMQTLIHASADATSVSANGDHAVSHRVIADHLRACSFLIADGVLPSNEGRGYVLRRIMRRAMRHAHILGAKDPLIHRLVPALVTEMGTAYKELGRAQSLITETLLLEENRFRKTLDKGLKLLEQETDSLADGETLKGDVAFKLYDTYGFPLDLTQDVLRGQKRDVDLDGFNTAMEAQKAEARKSWSGSGDAATDTLWYDIKEQRGAAEFIGYDATKAEAVVTDIIKDGKMIEAAKSGDTVQLILNQTVFYGESGGQIGDTGSIENDGGLGITVTDTQKKLGAVFVHECTLNKGVVKVGDAIAMTVDSERRDAIKANHSATHLLHEALRRVLGEHVAQKGSLVTAERLRFDISHQKALTAEEIMRAEQIVNDRIRENASVTTKLLPIDDAIESGALAMFGEKYDDEVRVLAMGGSKAADKGRDAFSVELCGGTHVHQMGDIGLLKITSESAVGAGVRRIEAVTGAGALALFQEQAALIDTVSTHLKVPATQIEERVGILMDERKKMDRELSDLKRKLAVAGNSSNDSNTSNDIKDISGISFTGRVLNDLSPKDLKPLADDLKQKMGSGIVTLVAINEGRASVVVGVTDDLTSKYSAVDLVRVASESLGGKGGGGRRDMAQAGGPDGDKANDALVAVEKAIAV